MTKKTTNPIKKQKSKPEIIAEKGKQVLQILIAIGICLLLFFKILNHFNAFPTNFMLNDFLKQNTLQIVGECLAYSAGIDLAYMLLTPGPDEAIEPLILGLASAILFSVSKIDKLNITLALEIGVYVIVLACLFVMRELFIEDEYGNKQWNSLFQSKKTKK